MSADATSTQCRLGDLRIDLARQRVLRDDGQLLDVAGLSFRLLRHLLLQGQRVVGFDELIAQVWAPAIVNEDTVTQRVRLLRQALGDDVRQPRYLRSVRGQGYQLCVAPEWMPSPVPVSTAHIRRRIMIALSCLLALAAAVIGWHWLHVEDASTASPLLQRAAYYAAIGQHDNNERALALYAHQLQVAPDDRAALLGLSRAHSARTCLYNGSVQDAVRGQALAAQAIAQQPDDAAGYAARGYARDCLGQVDAALDDYEHALRLDPGLDAVRASIGYLYERRGRLAEALATNLAVRAPAKARFLTLQIASTLALLGDTASAEARYRRSFLLYPDNVFSNQAWPAFLFTQGRQLESAAALAQALERGTDHAALQLLAAELALHRGDTATARQAAARALQLRAQGSLPQTLVWWLAERRPPAPQLRAQASALQAGIAKGHDPIDGLDAALLFTMAGDRDAALAALDAAVTGGYRDAAYLRASPLFATLRPAPGFTALMARIDAMVAVERRRADSAGLLERARLSAPAPP